MQAKARLTGKSLGRPEGSSGAKTRARLMQIAATLFATNGYSGVTLADVAGAAGLTAPSIYNHFSSKDELFIATVVEMYREIETGFRRATAVSGGWREKTRRLLQAAAELYREDGLLQRLGAVANLESTRSPERFAVIVDAQRAVDDVFSDIFLDAQRSGELPASIDPHVAGDILSACIMGGLATVTFKRSTQEEFNDLAEVFAELFLNSNNQPVGDI